MYGKRILLGITGGIAAYKIAYLIRILKKKEAEVKCIMTPASSDFISPLVVSTLSENEVSIEFWDKSTGKWNNHVEYAKWADVFLIAPATMNTVGKMANGLCDNLLLATYFSMKNKTIVAPAMDLDMYKHPGLKRNFDLLKKDGVSIIPAESGELASGLIGEGRLSEPETIAGYLEAFLHSETQLEGRVLITAGPTYEHLDPVRYLGNHSSGKMGFSIAKAALSKGYAVELIAGPSKEELVHPNLKRHDVISANEMLVKVEELWETCHYGIFSAAVADYRPAEKSSNKIKKNEGEINMPLIKNPDILSWASAHRKNKQKVIGFALETNNEEENALTKLESKNLDMIVLNSTQDDQATFGGDLNKVTIFDKNKNKTEFPLKSKLDIGFELINLISKIDD
jgi:phosphopantothenoylcysteine decarboxylase / phosphopantothenate---cysteine ligase